MADIAQAFLTAGLAFGFGIAGLSVAKVLVEPVLEQRRLRGRIANALTYYGNFFYVPGGTDAEGCRRLDEAKLALRKLAGDLRESRHAIPCYRLFERLRVVIPRASLQCAAAELIGWSNSLYDGDRYERRVRIGEHLQIGYDVDVTPGTRDTRQISSTESSRAPGSIAA